ncbi:Late embryogenesis abundant protein, SMP subgroup domain [Dillenia turbinata]|uniref:Late embryogenesis abundant protein, SMP subgroup domain n=1 Tax=Dillenia turbinata TaxID=194707 RepID=A0AAN8YQH4_9MAGN
MSHEQLRRPHQQPIKNGGAFAGTDDSLTGQSLKGGPAAWPNMQNEHAGLAGLDDLFDKGEDQSVSIAETVVPGRGFITESVRREDARGRLPVDKPVTHRDAEGVITAKSRTNPNLTTFPGGVADSVVSAARLNQQNKNDLKQD